MGSDKETGVITAPVFFMGNLDGMRGSVPHTGGNGNIVDEACSAEMRCG